MKQTSTNRMEVYSTGQAIRKNAFKLFIILAMSGTSLTYAQRVANTDINPVVIQPSGEKNPGSGTVKGNVIVAPIAPTISSLQMLDMGHDKAILTWDNMSNFDSIIFRYAPSGASTTRIVAISGNPNPERYYLLGLQSQTTYDIEVSTVASNGVRSSWSSPLTVTTLTEPTPRLSQGNTNRLIVNPNPATTLTNISFVTTNSMPQQVSIVSSAGRVMYSRQIIPNDDKVQMTIDVTAYPPGIYMVRVNNNSNVSVERLIKL